LTQGETSPQRGDGDHVVGRLESFSDVVIGFSLAQTALNLFMPPHPADFITRPVGIVGFTFTFAVIASFWWTHSAIFRYFFVINRPMVFFNFVSLALIVLQVFALQMWLHFGQNQADDIEAARIYFGVFAATQATLALLSAMGLRYRWAELRPALQQAGVRRTIEVGFRAAGMLIGVLTPAVAGTLSVSAGTSRVIAVPLQILFGLLLGIIAGRIASRIVIARLRREGSPQG
jgi:uncharacterized membrane protein